MNSWKRNTLIFLLSQTVSFFGSALVQYAITWHITLKTQSGIMMTISILCGFLPTFFLSPFAGVWADRYNRKMLIILSDGIIAFATLILALFFLGGYEKIWLLFVVSAIRAVGSGVQIPAVGAFLPQIVPQEELTRINAVNSSVQAAVMLAAPMLSGILLTVSTIESIFFIDVVTAMAAIILLRFFLPALSHAKALERHASSYFEDLKMGYRYIRNHEYIKKFFLFCAVFFVLIGPAAFLTPLQVARSFGDDVWRLTAIEIVFSVGMMSGGILMASWKGFINKIYTMTFSCVIVSICTIALGLVSDFSVYLLIMGLTGLSIPIFNTPSAVLLQEKVEESYLGRVFGIMGMISSVMMPIGMLVFGPMSDRVKIEWLLVGTGLLLFVQAFFLLGSKVLVEAGKPSPGIKH